MNDDLPPLITARELATLLHDPALLVVDCRFDLADTTWGQRGYDAAHLPGAIYAHLDRDLSGPITPATGRHPLPSPDAFASTLAAWGVTPATRIVAYDQGPGPYAARLRWLLRASGHARAQVLDGGLAAWKSAGLPLDDDVPRRVPAPMATPRPFDGWLTTDAVADGLRTGAMRLVDARPADRFAGRNETIDPVPGRVPGAVNHPFGSNLGPDGTFLPPATLAERWRARLGDVAPRDAVMMCGSGVTACHNLLAMEVAGLPGARLYAGSYSEWIRDPARAVATGEPS
jgi:thiosulfate/3-mercaptopyruvate sulfurtransferase